jgi:hypothetical protein
MYRRGPYSLTLQLDELEPEQKEKLSARCRQTILNHWLAFINSCRVSSRRSSANNSYITELRELNRWHAPRPSPFEFREIGGETLRFHHPSGEAVIKIGNSYLPFGEVPPSRAREINQSVFMVVENYLRSWPA